jgi:hypothetical protein
MRLHVHYQKLIDINTLLLKIVLLFNWKHLKLIVIKKQV